MVRVFLSAFTHEVRGLHEAAYLLAAFALSSQLLGLIRDRLLAGPFGAGETLDVYYAAFRIPDVLFATVASLLSLYALLPILSRLEEENQGFAIAFLPRSLPLFFWKTLRRNSFPRSSRSDELWKRGPKKYSKREFTQ